jgi:DNA primase
MTEGTNLAKAVSTYSPEFIGELRRRADIAAVIQDYLFLTQTGATHSCRCPFHVEHTASFHVHQRKGFFHCFGCGVSGDVIRFVQLRHGIGFDDAVKKLAIRIGVPLPDQET